MQSTNSTMELLPVGRPTIDWDKCMFCQRVLNRVNTSCPANSKGDNIGAGYISLENDVAGFEEVGELPPGLVVATWDEGYGTAATCLKKQCLLASTMQNYVTFLYT